MEYLSIYDQDMRLLAMPSNADKISYQLQHNDLWTASFALPTSDPDNQYCTAHNLVKLPDDGGRKLGLYRIIGIPDSDETGLQGLTTYNVEHVMATLLDDVLFGYHEVGGTGVTTRQVMQYILDQQTETRWRLGACEFSDQFQYHFENVSLLSALLSLGEVLTEDYTWDFDTDTTPWTVNLRRADSAAGCGIHYQRNLVSIHKSMDASALVTRLYPLGYGEGVNQLTIEGVNGLVPYIDADTIDIWGVKCSVWTDTRIQDARTLMARGQQVLDGCKNPYISYTASALDLYRLTGHSWDNFMPGKRVRVMDGEHGIHFDARIVTIAKKDVRGDPGRVEITIANAPRDAADSINTLADRVGIGELYSQGATNLFAIPFADNADPTHPAKFRVYIPEGMVRINKMLLSWQIAAFRAYSTGAAAGGGSVRTSGAGGSSTQTTTVSDTVVYSSEYGGDCVVSTSQRIVAKSEDSGELIGWTFGPRDNDDGNVMNNTGTNNGAANTGAGGGHAHSIPGHSHTIYHTHVVNEHSHRVNEHSHGVDIWGAVDGGYVEINGVTDTSQPYTDGRSPGTGNPNDSFTGVTQDMTTGWEDDHTHSVPTHSHGMNHIHRLASFTIPPLSIEIPAHGHNVRIPGHNHSVDIPAHTHDVTLPEHTHGIVYGIYEGGRASSVTILVDGTAVPASEVSKREIDVSSWLSKDGNGRIRRGAWHEIQIVPDALTRIEANLTAQVFVQSVGGGDY